MAQLFETLCMMLAFKESHSLAVHYCRLVWDVRSLSNTFTKQFKLFQMAVEKQNIPVFKRLLKTTIAWKKEIIQSVSTGYSNGFTEGCNTTIKNLKRICYSFRNFNNFKNRIIYLLNNPQRRNRRTKRNNSEICA